MPYKNKLKSKQYHTQASKQYYLANKEKMLATAKAWRKENKPKKRAFINRVKRRFGCSKCGLRNPICLDFHHLKDKKINIGTALASNWSIESLKAEIRKCQILCANCHRIEEARIKEQR